MLASQSETIYYPETDGKPMAETDTHRNLLLGMVDLLQNAFPESYVSGNICLYYEQGNPRKMISPDALLCRSQPKSEKRVYLAWKEDSQLDLVMEFSSASTKRVDHHKKKQIYAERLQVPYYLIFDPHALYLHLFEWTPHGYQVAEANAKGHWEMPLLGLEVGLELPNSLRLFNARGYPILKSVEREAKRAEAEAQRAEREAKRAEAEAQKAQREAKRAEAEAQRAEAEAQKAQREAKRAEVETQRAEKEAKRAEVETQRAEREAKRANQAEAENQALREELEKLRSRSNS